MAETMTDRRVCRCGHSRDAHEHYRPGTDCSACGCARLRWPGRAPAWAWLLLALSRRGGRS